MFLKKFLLFGLIAAILPAVAEEAADRKTATSLKYVEHELSMRQNKFTAEQNKAMEYTNSAGTVQKRAVTSDLDNGGTDSLPMVGGVNVKLNMKQDDIAAVNDHTAVTYTGQPGGIGRKGIYQTSESYANQSDNLIDAKTFNAALKNGLDSEFVCREDNLDPVSGLCWLYTIHNNIGGMLPDGYTELEYVKNNTQTLIDTGIKPDVDDMEFEIEAQPSTGSWYILQARNGAGGAVYGISGSVSGDTITFGWNGALVSLRSDIVRNPAHVYHVKATAKNGVATLYVHDLTAGVEDTKTTTYTYRNSTNQNIFVWGNSGGDRVAANNMIHYARIKKSGRYVMNYVPVIYNNAAGFYDMVSGEFKPATSGSIVAGPVSSDPNENVYIPQNQN